MSTLQLFCDWFAATPGSNAYMLARGRFDDSTELSGQRVAVVQQMGGRAPQLTLEFPQVRLILMGVRDGRSVPGEVPAIETFAQAVFDRAWEVPRIDCLMQINRLGSIMGPYYTTEDRPWYSLNFEVIR